MNDNGRYKRQTDNEANRSRLAFPPGGISDQSEQSFQQVHQSAAQESTSWYIPVLFRPQIPVCMKNQRKLELDLTKGSVKEACRSMRTAKKKKRTLPWCSVHQLSILFSLQMSVIECNTLGN